MSYEMKFFDIRVNFDAVERLDNVEKSIVIFNLLRRLAARFGGRVVHDAMCRYFAMNGYDVHKL